MTDIEARVSGTRDPVEREALHQRIHSARIRRLRQILMALVAIFAAVLVINIWTSEPGVLLVMGVTIVLLMLAWWPLQRQDPSAAATIMVLVLAVSLALMMWQGSGLRSSAMFTYPGLLIFCLMVGSRRLFWASWAGILLWMVFLTWATHQGWREGSEHFSSWLTLLEFMVIISAVTLFIRLLAGDLFNLLEGLELDRQQATTSHREARHMAMHDKLTGLPNRRMAEPLFSAALLASEQSGRSAALVFIDIDDFKEVNDAHGHEVGDAVLLEITRRIVDRLRKTDALIRFAGDEFLLLLSQIDRREEISGLLETLCQHINEPMDSAGTPLRVAVSMGVVVAPEDGSDFETLLRGADRAMYRAKDAGRNQYMFLNGTSLSDAATDG